jgi:hypothetical protein
MMKLSVRHERWKSLSSLKNYPSIWVKVLKRTSSQVSRSLFQESNLGPPVYETEVFNNSTTNFGQMHRQNDRMI